MRGPFFAKGKFQQGERMKLIAHMQTALKWIMKGRVELEKAITNNDENFLRKHREAFLLLFKIDPLKNDHATKTNLKFVISNYYSFENRIKKGIDFDEGSEKYPIEERKGRAKARVDEGFSSIYIFKLFWKIAEIKQVSTLIHELGHLVFGKASDHRRQGYFNDSIFENLDTKHYLFNTDSHMLLLMSILGKDAI